MLTPQLSKLLSFLDAKLAVDGFCPSYEEMMQAVGLRSKSGINRMILELEERGYIRRIPARARAIEVIRRPGAPSVEVAIGVLRELRLTARVLLQNSEGCAVNHYGGDHELFGMPGWLRDSEAVIEKAEAFLITHDPTFASPQAPVEGADYGQRPEVL